MAQAPSDLQTSGSGGALPHNTEAERALLGALILDNGQIDLVMERLPAEVQRQLKMGDEERRRRAAGLMGAQRWRRNASMAELEPLFYSRAHQLIFAALTHLHEKGAGVDLTTLAEELLLRGQLEMVGGAPFLAGLEDDIFALSQTAAYADIVVQKWRLRCLVRTNQAIIDEATHSEAAVEEIIDHAEKQIFDLSLQQQSQDFVHARHVLPDLLTEIGDRARGLHDKFAGLATGFKYLDQMTSGLRGGQLIILAARPSMGKSAFSLNIAANVALRGGLPVGVFTLEMSKSELLNRLLATEAKVAMSRLLGKQPLRRDELDLVHEAAERIDKSPLYIDETSSLGVIEMRARARRLKSRCPDLALIVVDYLQLMSGSGRAESRQQEVAEISRSLKVLAGELQIPIIALSQLSRESEKRRGTKDRLPRLSDLRDSGAIEQDADIVIFIHREREPEDLKFDGPKPPEEAIVHIGKHRNGRIGNIDMLFRGEYTEFVDVALREG
jgi:replicative DNA helicase